MGEFRIGRTFARHSYPDGPRAASAAFARNSALGPQTSPVAIATEGAGGTQIQWAVIESKGSATLPPGVVDIPITPRVTGIIRILGMIVVKNAGLVVQDVVVQAQIDGSAISTPIAVASVDPFVSLTVPGTETIPFVLDLIPPISGAPLPLGVTSHVEILLLGLVTSPNSSNLELLEASIDIQELPAATG